MGGRRDSGELTEPTAPGGAVAAGVTDAAAVAGPWSAYVRSLFENGGRLDDRDIEACAAKYRSFRVSDCSYQPFGGGARSMCEAGGTTAQSTEPAGLAPAPTAGAPKQTDAPSSATPPPVILRSGPRAASPRCFPSRTPPWPWS